MKNLAFAIMFLLAGCTITPIIEECDDNGITCYGEGYACSSAEECCSGACGANGCYVAPPTHVCSFCSDAGTQDSSTPDASMTDASASTDAPVETCEMCNEGICCSPDLTSCDASSQGIVTCCAHGLKCFP